MIKSLLKKKNQFNFKINSKIIEDLIKIIKKIKMEVKLDLRHLLILMIKDLKRLLIKLLILIDWLKVDKIRHQRVLLINFRKMLKKLFLLID